MAEATSQLNILIKVRDEATAAMRSMSNSLSDLGGSLNFAGMKAGVLAGALAAIGGAAIGGSIKAFADAEVQTARFEAILRTLPPSLQAYRAQILAAANNALRFGFDSETAAVTLVRFLAITGNMKDALFGLQIAMDFARLKGISLGQATDLLARAWVNGGRVLAAFGIDVDDTIKGMGTWLIVAKQSQGQAEGFAQTLRGMTTVLRAYINEIMKAIGQPFAEWIKIVLGWLFAWIEAQGDINALIEKHQGLIIAAGAAMVGVFGAGIAAAASAALSALGPFGMLLAAIGALIGIASTLYTAWSTNFIGVRDIVLTVIKAIKDQFEAFISDIQKIINAFERLYEAASRAISTAKSIGSNVVKSARGVLGLQEGGIVTRPTFALIGEAGAEAVIPLNRLAGAGIGGRGITINLYGDFYTDTETAERFANQIARIIKYQLKL
jgi:hypothetical protein